MLSRRGTTTVAGEDDVREAEQGRRERTWQCHQQEKRFINTRIEYMYIKFCILICVPKLAMYMYSTRPTFLYIVHVHVYTVLDSTGTGTKPTLYMY